MRPFGAGRSGLLGQIVAILLLAMAIELVASTLLYERASEFAIRDDGARRLGEHLVIARQLLDEAPVARRPALARTLSTDHYETRWLPRPPAPTANELGAMRRQIIAWEPSLALTDLRIARPSRPLDRTVIGGLSLKDGSWLAFRTRGTIGGSRWWSNRIIVAALLAMIVTALAALLVRVTVHPLQRLARAADRFGGDAAQKVEESGPVEVRKVIVAFNGMQSRIQRLITEQTRGLAAVAHDLRTPLSRLRLRTDQIERDDLRASIGNDISEMEAMLASLFAFLGGETDSEAPTLTDIAVLCATAVDDAADHGHRVDYHGPDHCEHRVRRFGLKRAVTNLLDNALHHGTAATVSLEVGERVLVIAVEDDGPGIPEESVALVMQPFVRLDESRQRNTPGLGLGLAIVTRMIAAEGGSLKLSNRATGGLRAEIHLPRR